MSVYTCSWGKYVDDEGQLFYLTDCGTAHVFTVGSPKDNDFEYCPYCGKGIEADE